MQDQFAAAFGGLRFYEFMPNGFVNVEPVIMAPESYKKLENHEVGHGENRRFFWKTIVVYHSKPFRVYYMARNTICLNKKHPKIFGKLTLVKKMLASLTRILLYEDHKVERLKFFWKGIYDANAN